jgi:hypothetical protein
MPARIVVSRIALLATLLVVGSCDEPPPTAPGPQRSALDGTWSGQVADRVRGAGQVQLVVAGYEATALGTFAIEFAAPASRLVGDATADTRDSPTVDLYLRAPGAPGCQAGQGLVLHARLALTENRLTGTYDDLVPCGEPGGGSIALTRR